MSGSNFFEVLPPGTPDPRTTFNVSAQPAFSKEAVKALADAVGRKQDRCHMDGRAMNINYELSTYEVWVSPANGDHTPCGYFRYETLKGGIY